MTDCIIVGGGISGMLTALELENAGLRVLLLERGKLGAESSWAGGGIISPLYPWRYADAVNQLANYSQQVFPGLADTLQLQTGIDPQYTRSGLLLLDNDELDAANPWCERWQKKHETLNNEKLLVCEPALSERISDTGLWMPDVAQIRNPRLVKALAASLQVRHIEFREQTPVIDFMVNENRIVGVKTQDDQYMADKVVVASGAWTGQLMQQLDLQINVKPVKGQMILLKGQPDQVRRIVLYQGRYIIPRLDGRILVGSTLEYTEFEKQTTLQARDELLQAAINIIPSLATLDIEHHWAGLRPGTEHGIPYIGEHPTINGLYFNAGHYRNGVVLGPASAHLLADLVIGREPIMDPVPYGITVQH